jgi:Erythromycin biosynthesis protein CIII-like, C-terminal domain
MAFMPQAKRILLCWEFGGGNGHVKQLKIIGDRLAAEGLSVAYALRRPEVGAAVGIAVDAIRPAPNWPLRSPPSGSQPQMTTATYGDSLAQLMLGPHDDLSERLQRWQAIIDTERPDLVIADYSPSVSLLCHGRIPVVAIGNGYVLPPTSLLAFPRLLEDVPLQYQETAVVERLNEALQPHNGTHPISAFPQINRADLSYLLALPCIDPYRARRDGGWLGSLDARGIGRTQRSQSLFAYFNEAQQTDMRLIEGFVQTHLKGKAVFSFPVRRTIKKLEPTGIIVPDGLAHLPDELANCGVIVHQGSAGMAMAGIAAGIPQVMIGTDLEKILVGEAIAAHNAGIVLGWSSFDAPQLAMAIRTAVESDAMLGAARQLSLENTRYLELDPLAEITKGATALI